jgi:hypothetical protein
MSSSERFIQLLQHLVDGNNQIRSEAERYYNNLLQTSCDDAIIGLMQSLSNPVVNIHLRQLAAVLLRRCLVDEEDSYYFKLQLATREFIVQELSRLLQEETITSIRIKVCDIAGELGGSILEPKDWPSLYPTTVALCKVSLFSCHFFLLRVAIILVLSFFSSFSSR